MSFFTGNRKVRPRRAKSAMDVAVSPRAKSRQLDKHAREVKEQIERLECTIAQAPHLQQKRRLANMNMVPPMERPTQVPRQRRVPIAQRRARRGEHLRLLTEGILIIGIIAAVVGWLNQSFHFWH